MGKERAADACGQTIQEVGTARKGRTPEGCAEPSRISSEGLRQRKKAKARLGVERSALELVIERGFDGVTVEDICARAEISKKTFFNYFSSKAAAVMGRADPFPDDEHLFRILEEHADACYIDVLVGIIGIAYASSVDDAVVDLRREALRSMPHLFFQGQRELSVAQRSMSKALRSYLVDRPERRMLAERPLDEEVLLASSVIISIARTRSMLNVYGEEEPSAADTRRLMAAYLSDAV